jgi:peptidoglycan-associated lipoprotein
MTRGKISILGLHALQVMLVAGCMMGLLAGCSSSLRTTIVSGSEGQKLPVVQVEPEPAVVETVAAQPILEIINPAVQAFDIPVEEPARAVIRPEPAREIFATSRTPDVPSEIPSRFEASPLPVPPSSQPNMQIPAVEIPAMAFEPELPAMPTLRGNPVSSVEEPPVLAQAEVPSIPDVSAKKGPIQVAKVMPQEPKKVAVTTETLEKALSDIYFDYDRFAIRGDAVQILRANAELLSAKLAESEIVIEGHCDERGTQSYNMVLGEARANAVKTFLEDLGISGEKLQVVSYGKDKPFCREQTEECWQENRRGHFVIK